MDSRWKAAVSEQTISCGQVPQYCSAQEDELPGDLAVELGIVQAIIQSDLRQTPERGQGTYTHITVLLLSTAIGLRKYRIPSDLRSQAEYRLVSTTVGDHVGILGAVVFALLPGESEKWWERCSTSEWPLAMRE